MKKPKAIRRALSLILAVMLLAGMLPMGAFAAETTGVKAVELTVNPDSSDWVDFQIMAAKSLHDGEGKLSDGGNTPDADHTDRTGVQLMRGYIKDGLSGGTMATNAKFDFSTVGQLVVNDDGELEKSDANTAVLDKMVTLSNSLFQDETNLGQTVLEVKPGDTFYLGFNLAGHYNGNIIKGIVGFASAIAMDVETFKVNFTNSGTGIGYVANNMLTAKGSNSESFAYSILSTVPDYAAYAGSTALVSSGTSNTLNSVAKSGFSFVFKQNADNYIPEKTTWDLLMRVTVDANAEAKTYTIGSSPDTATPNRVLWCDVDPSTVSTAGTIYDTALAAGESTGNLKSNTIQIKVKGTPKPVTFSSIAYDASANGRPKVTFDASSGKAAPSGMSYKIGADGTWKSLTNNEGAGKTSGSIDDSTATAPVWTVGDEVFNALIAGKEVLVSSDEGETPANTLTFGVSKTTSGQDVKVAQVTAPTGGTGVTIDYSAAQLTATAASGYEIQKTDGTYESAASVDVTAGTAFKYRAKGTASGIPSTDVEVTPESDGTINASTADTTWAQKVDGKTLVKAGATNALLATDKYIVKATSAGAPAASDWSGASAIGALTSGVEVAATENDTIYFYRAGASGTPGASGSIAGVGYAAAGEISMTSPTAVNGDAAKAVLTIAGDKGKFANASKITVTKGGTTVSTASAALTASTSEPTHSDVVATITNNADWDKDTDYTVTVATDAVTPNLSAAKTFTFRVEDKGYKLVPVNTAPTNTLTYSYAPGQLVASGTIDVTITGVPTGQEIDTVTAGGTALTKKSDGVYTYTAPTTPATKVENVDLVVTLKDKTYAALEYTVAEKYPVDAAISITPKAVDPDLTHLTATVNGDAKKSAIKFNAATGAITAAADSLTPGATYTVEITDTVITQLPKTTVTINVGNAGATPVIADKYYDGTTDVDETKITFQDKTGTALPATVKLDGEATYASADAGAAVGVTFSQGAKLTGDGSTGYDLVTSGITGKIVADTIASATVKDGVACAADMDALYDAIQEATVTVTTTNGQKEIALGTLMSGISDTDLKAIIDPLLVAAGFKSEDPDNPGTDIADITTMSSGDTLDITIPAANITLDTTTQANLGSTMQPVTFTYTVKKKPVVNPGGPTVIIDDRSYGVASTTEVVVDENGKIVELPTVTDVVKGATFLGWSTNGDKAHIIDPETYVVKEDEELTLTAVYEGYMAGNKHANGSATADAGNNVTRGQLARMLVVASGQYDTNVDYGKPSFSDAQSGWWTPYIARAEELGILHGDGNTANTVRPDAPVTRQEASIMIATAFGVTTTDGATTDKVIDFNKVPDWAKKYVAALCDNGTINGYDDKTFRGEGNITRAESAQMINIYLGLTEADKDAIKADDSIVSPFPDVKEKDWTYANIMFASLSVPATYYSTEITIPEAK